MNGSIWSVVALGTGIVMLPLILPSTGGGDATGSAIFDLVTSVAPAVGLTFVVVVFGLLVSFIGSDGGF